MEGLVDRRGSRVILIMIMRIKRVVIVRREEEDLVDDMINHQVVPIYPPLSSAKLEGLGEGAKLNEVYFVIVYFLIIIMTCKIMSFLNCQYQGDVIPLSCEIDFTHEAEFLTWLVDGEIQVDVVQ